MAWENGDQVGVVIALPCAGSGTSLGHLQEGPSSLASIPYGLLVGLALQFALPRQFT